MRRFRDKRLEGTQHRDTIRMLLTLLPFNFPLFTRRHKDFVPNSKFIAFVYSSDKPLERLIRSLPACAAVIV